MADGLSWREAVDMIASGTGILSNWWRTKGLISPPEIATVLVPDNLDRHLHDYANFGPSSPFISLAAGAVIRDPATMTNLIYRPLDIALSFATLNGTRAGAVFYCWTVVGFHSAIDFDFISEPVRDLLIYHGWSPYHHEGEIAAKVHIPANQIEKVEWWDPANSLTSCTDEWANRSYNPPTPLLNERGLLATPSAP